MKINSKLTYKNTLLSVSIFLNVYLVLMLNTHTNAKIEIVEPVTVQIEQGVTTEASIVVEKKEEVVLSERELIDIYIKEISDQYKIDEYLIHSIVWYESRYISKAVNKTSGCAGLMQVCPRWHKARAERLNVTDFSDPYSSILLGVDYISELKSKYKDDSLVLMLYNMSHKKAFEMYNNGQISNYAKKVLARASQLRNE